MLSWPLSVRVFVYTGPTDMRRSFDRLAQMVQEFLHENPFSGHLFVFVNRRGDRMKVLFWDRSGFCLFYKRLEEGVFHLPACSGMSIEIDVPRLTLILEGLDISKVRRQKRYDKIPNLRLF
jgi:transposase